MSDQALITLGLLQDHDTLLKGYVDEKYKDFAMGYDYYSSIGNVSLTESEVNGKLAYNEVISDSNGDTIATKQTVLSQDRNAIFETIQTGLNLTGEKKYRLWIIDGDVIECIWCDPVFSNNSWSTIATVSNAGMANIIWDADGSATKDVLLSNGETLVMQIIDFDHDDLSDGSGKAGISFRTRYAYQTEEGVPMFNENWDYESEAYYFTDSLLYQKLVSIYETFPQELKDAIKQVDKITFDWYGTPPTPDGNPGTDGNYITESMKLFLFSEREFFGDMQCDVCKHEGEAYTFFEDLGNVFDFYEGDYYGEEIPECFTRTSDGDSGFITIIHDGGPTYENFDTTLFYIYFGFCI